MVLKLIQCQLRLKSQPLLSYYSCHTLHLVKLFTSSFNRSSKLLLDASQFRNHSALIYYSKRHLSNNAPQSVIPGENIRNIGIIAHIDAGKTTTTERMLYYSGITDEIGEVHDGDTVTDYLEQERQRGITITSASVTFPWKKHRINLIDTPGHVDFTVEVERSLSVLDSAIVVLDASAGVEAQTVTVWSQADRHKVPRIVYLNKMDKATANVEMCLDSIKKLGQNPLLIHLPLFNKIDNEKNQFNGLIDVITMQKLIWKPGKDSDGSSYELTSLEAKDEHYEDAKAQREEIAASLADFDEIISDRVLSLENLLEITSGELTSALRRVTNNHKILPVLLGSSYKNIGVQNLMNASISLLPSPLDRVKEHVLYYDGHFCGLAFKVIHHKMLGALTFVRIYTGEIKPKSSVYNVNRNQTEKVMKVFVALADEFKEVPVMSAGNIVVISGLDCITGDTLVSSQAAVSQACERMSNRNITSGGGTNRLIPAPAVDSKEDEDDGKDESDDTEDTKTIKPILAGPEVPEPVFFCTIEAPSASKQKDLEIALAKLQREDPSLRVKIDPNGQISLAGMGELHLEVIKDRLLTEHSLKAYMGPLQVAYRESIKFAIEESTSISKFIYGTKNSCTLTLALRPCDTSIITPKIKKTITKENELGKLDPRRLKAIQNGVDKALFHGPLLNFPVVGVQVYLLWFQATRDTTPAFVSTVASSCIESALKKASITLLEPMMKLDIRVPSNYSTKIISDLSCRRSQLGSVAERNSIRTIQSITPLSELVNYSSVLRTISSGTASFSIEFSHYLAMTESEKKTAIEKITSFF